jgi:RNA polymerase sigma-70 factor (ECF subfamily)
MVDEERREKPVDAAATPVHPEPAREVMEGLEGLFHDHHGAIFRAAYRITGSAQDAEDALQTVFLRLARREGGASFLSGTPGSYLHRAAVNAALDIVRSRQSARATPLEDVEIHLAGDETEGPERRQAGGEIRDHLRVALGKLNARAAEIFVLRYVEGYGNKEIAQMLGMARTTVAVILHRARNRLREELGALAGATS